jgi:hypothetical protein
LKCSSSASPWRLLKFQNLSFDHRFRLLPLCSQRINRNASSLIKWLVHFNLCFFILILVYLAFTPCLITQCHRTTLYLFSRFYLEFFDLLQILKGLHRKLFFLSLKHILNFFIKARSLRHHCCLRIIFESQVNFIKFRLLIFLFV